MPDYAEDEDVHADCECAAPQHNHLHIQGRPWRWVDGLSAEESVTPTPPQTEGGEMRAETVLMKVLEDLWAGGRGGLVVVVSRPCVLPQVELFGVLLVAGHPALLSERDRDER
jgi:hypothetical protein